MNVSPHAFRLSGVRIQPGSRRPSKRAGRPQTDSPTPIAASVFLNIPYDEDFSDLYVAYIAGAASFGLLPRAAIEIPGGTALDDTLIFGLHQFVNCLNGGFRFSDWYMRFQRDDLLRA